MSDISILLVEDETQQRELIGSILSSQGFDVSSVGSAEKAIQLMAGKTFDLIISDWKLPGMSGEDLLEHLKAKSPETGFILITAHSDSAHAIRLMRAGADDYLPKPFDRNSLLFSIGKLLHTRGLESENRRLKAQTNQRDQLEEMIGASKAMNQLYTRIDKAAPTQATILINGESGTGKELAARALHRLSNRSDAIFLPINCAAIPESLAEAELFGSEKGAYTGASCARKGSLESANGGSIFLDEIGEMPLNLQSKLLRFLQEGTISRVGSHQELQLNVRVLAATNRDLLSQVKQGHFREDLYYRLNVIPITLPPLRERSEDLVPLIQHFLTQASHLHNIETKQLSSPALKALLAYDWPGNVRQLKNVVERLALLAMAKQISLDEVRELNLKPSNKDASFKIPQQGFSWLEHEKDCLKQALNSNDNNRTQAAKQLGLSYKAFLYRLEKHNLS